MVSKRAWGWKQDQKDSIRKMKNRELIYKKLGRLPEATKIKSRIDRAIKHSTD